MLKTLEGLDAKTIAHMIAPLSKKVRKLNQIILNTKQFGAGVFTKWLKTYNLR